MDMLSGRNVAMGLKYSVIQYLWQITNLTYMLHAVTQMPKLQLEYDFWANTHF